MENIPDSLLNLIQTKSFELLTPDEQQLVLQHMSETEFRSLHHTSSLLSQTVEPFPIIESNLKNKLMTQFMQHRPVAYWQAPIPFWKAASIMLLLGAGWLIHWQSYHKTNASYITQLDTVYLEKEVPVKVYDTVYYKEEPTITYTTTTPPTQEVKTRKNIQMIEGSEYKRRGVSAKDDTLIQSFKFVTL